MDTIRSLFTLFSGETDTTSYLPLMTAAVQEITAQLREDADGEDVRLCYLAAAIANLRYAQLLCSREKMTAVYAGTVPSGGCSEIPPRLAMQLAESYRGLCADLLTDTALVFRGIRKEDADAPATA